MRRPELETGEVLSVRKREDTDHITYLPTIRYSHDDGTPGEFEGTGYFEPGRLRVGDRIWIVITKGRPETFDPEAKLRVYFVVFGAGVLVAVAGLYGHLIVG